MKNFKELYLEHSAMINAKLPSIKHIDLWSDQISFLNDTLPFAAPAIFLSYRILRTEDAGSKSQNIQIGVDVFYYYETFAETRIKSKNKDRALVFLDALTEIHKIFHGTSGNNYSNMRRLSMSPVETGTAKLLYLTKFECSTVDDSALVDLELTGVENISITKEKIVRQAPEEYYPDIEVN